MFELYKINISEIDYNASQYDNVILKCWNICMIWISIYRKGIENVDHNHHQTIHCLGNLF